MVNIHRKDTGQVFAVGELVRITKTRIYLKDNETGAIDWYSRNVFEARRKVQDHALGPGESGPREVGEGSRGRAVIKTGGVKHERGIR